MKPLYLLTIALSFTQASGFGRLRTEPHENNLVRRIGGEYGNRPGERGYDYHQDPDYYRNGGTRSSEWLKDEDAYRRRNARNPPRELAPANPPSAYRSDYSSSSYQPETRRPGRDDQVERVRKLSYSSAKKYPNGDVWNREVGAEFPFPKQGFHPYTKGGGTAGYAFASGQVEVGTSQSAGGRLGLGPLFADSSYTTYQDHNPAPSQPQRVTPQQGTRRGTYFIHDSDGNRKPVYVDEHGDLRSENSDRRVHSKHVYLTNPRRRRSKRSPADVLGNIESTTNAPANNSESLSADWQSYYTIYNNLRTNATNLLMPIFEDLVSKSNTSYAYEMAWSIHSQLTGSPNEYLGGYYQNGLANFDNFTDTWLINAGFWLDSDGVIYLPQNSSIRSDNSTLTKTVQMLSANAYLQTTYYKTWNASVAALNKTQGGSPHTLLDDLVYYATVLTQTNDTNVMSQNFYTVDLAASQAEAAWFLDGLNTYF